MSALIIKTTRNGSDLYVITSGDWRCFSGKDEAVSWLKSVLGDEDAEAAYDRMDSAGRIHWDMLGRRWINANHV